MKRDRILALALFSLIVLIGILTASPERLPAAHSSNGLSYVGAQTCGTCHSEEYATWNQTDHANMAGIAEENASGTFYWVAYPTNVMNETDFIDRCASCHVTGWDPVNLTWPEKETDSGKFLNLQCEGCHGPGTDEPWGSASMVVNYSSSLCGQCHTQYGDWQKSAHSDSMTDLLASQAGADYCLSCMSTQGFLDEEVFLNSTGLEPVSCAACHDPHSIENEHNLRFENSTELCGQCHGSQSEFFASSPHERAEFECVSCHGEGTRLFHGEEEPWFNHTFGIHNTFYPFTQTEPMVCSNCHTQSWATSQLGVIQSLTEELLANVTTAIDNAKASIDVANQTAGVDQTKIDLAVSMIETAEDYMHDVESDSSEGFHNPEHTYTILGQAAHLTNEAQVLVFDSLASGTTALEAQVSSLQTQVASLEDQATALQADIESLESKIDELESAGATTPYLYGGIALALGFAIGAAIVLVARRGKQ